MASIRKDISKYWVAEFKLKEAGKWKTITRSTRILINDPTRSSRETAKEAQAVADTYEMVAKRGMKKREIRRVIENLATIHGIDVSVPICADWYRERQIYAEKRLSSDSLRLFTDAMNKMRKFFGKRFQSDILTDFTIRDFSEFKQWLVDSGLATSTINKTLQQAYSPFKEAFKMDMIDSDPTLGAGYVKESSTERKQKVEKKPFDSSQLELILDKCDDEWKSMILTSLYTGGQRIGDVATYKWEAFNLEEGTLKFRMGKTNNYMYLPIHARLLELLRLRKLNVTGEYVHPTCAEIYMKTNRAAKLSAIFGRILFQAGLIAIDPLNANKVNKKIKEKLEKQGVRLMNEYSFHSLRSSATVMLNAAGVPQSVAQAIVGHENKDIHLHYMKFGPDILGEALSKLPEF